MFPERVCLLDRAVVFGWGDPRRKLDVRELIKDLADDAKSLGEGCTSYASNVESIRGELLAMLGQLALEIAIDIGVGVALSFFTFGAGAAAGIAKAATTVARWIPKIIAVLNRLKTLIMSAKRTMAVMRRAAIESIKSTVESSGLSFRFRATRITSRRPA